MQANRIGLKYGLIAGVGVIAYFLLFYSIDKGLMLHFGIWWSSMIIYLLAMIFAARKTGSFEFRAKVQATFTTFLVANAAFYVFYYLLFGIIDPQLTELQREILLQHPGIGGDIAQQDLHVTLGRSFFYFCRSLIGGFVLAAGMAALVNR